MIKLPVAWVFIKKDPSTDIFLWVLRNFQEHHFYRTPPSDYLWFLRLFPKDLFRYSTKDNKMTLIEAVLVTLMPTLNVFLSNAITLGAAIKNNPSKSRKFSSEISAVEFRYSEIVVFEINTNFTYDSKTYDIGNLIPILWDFICLLIPVSSQFNMYIVVINLVNVSHLIYWF